MMWSFSLLLAAFGIQMLLENGVQKNSFLFHQTTVERRTLLKKRTQGDFHKFETQGTSRDSLKNLMAILISCVSSKALAPYTPEVPRLRPVRRNTGISVSAQRRQAPAGSTIKSWGIDRVQLIRRATQIAAVGPQGPGELPAGDLPFLNPFPYIPSWVTLVVGAFFAAVPLYRQMRAMQDKAEQTAEAAIEVVDKVAEAAEKIAEDVAEAFPGNESLKKAASRIKAVADEIEEDADKAEAFLRKLDQIEEEVDEAVDSFTKKKSKRKDP